MVESEYNILGKARILLVDGDDSIRTSMIDFYQDITRQFTLVKTAEEALPLLEGPLWDIVVCNLKLPGINGLEFSKLISERKPGTKIILATKYPNPKLKKGATKYGIVETVTAPLIPESLMPSLILAHSNVKAPEPRKVEKAEINFDVPETASIEELDETMIITAFVRFSSRYMAMSEQTKDWVRHNFKGARARVNRYGQELDLSVAEIEWGDDLRRIDQFPISLMNLTFVRTQLIKELKKRGFLAFEVKRKPTAQSLGQQIRLGAIRRTEEFINQVNESVGARDQTSEIVKEMISSGHIDNLNTYDLTNQVDDIVKTGSASALSVVASLQKSDPNYAHCVDIGAIFLAVYSHWVQAKIVKTSFENEADILLSAILHDIGKIFVPDKILESTASFDADSLEMEVIRNHPNGSAEILEDLNMPSVAINMAQFHHVKYNTSLLSSYPDIDRFDQLAIETRLLAIVDMFQALVGGRSYKRSWHPGAAIKYIDQLAGIECDPKVWVAFRAVLGWYPVGSLVELNDGSQAFVVKKGSESSQHPSVVVTRNSFNEELTHNTYIDLNEEKDVFIKRALDHVEIYEDQAINRFTQLRIS